MLISGVSGTGGGGGGGSSTTPIISANSGTAYNVAFPATGNAAYNITLTGNCVFTVSGGAAGQAQEVRLIVRGGAGGFIAALPATIKWPGGVLPAIDGTAGSYNEFWIRTADGGATYSGGY